MATPRTRKVRGAQTQTAVARYLQATLFPYAESAGAGRSGRDVLNTPGVAVEVKARAGLDPLEWVRQSRKASVPGELPVVVFRPNGLGLLSVGEWLVFITLEDFVVLLERAGYGTPPPAEGAMAA
jgi:hypothetical protein